MFTLPIAVFFLLHDRLIHDWEHKTMYSGFAAVAMANFVILLYIISVWREPSDEEPRKSVKVGRFKKD